ncbi:MAG: hypothetical protein ACRCZF_19000 [Gemmataceae bacterium]
MARTGRAARDPHNVEWQTDLFFSHFKIGQAHLNAGNLGAARPWLDRAAEQLQQFQQLGWFTAPQQQMGTNTFGHWQQELIRAQAIARLPQREPAPVPRCRN